MTFKFGSTRHQLGMQTETDFYNLMKDLGHNITYSTLHEDITKHIDFHVDGMTIDVKGVKRINGRYQDRQTWVEVDGEYTPGWLYAPHVSHFAFKQLDGSFLIIRKEDLQDIIRKYYSMAKEITNDHNKISQYPQRYCYRRTGKDTLAALKKERVILVDTDLIRKNSTVYKK